MGDIDHMQQDISLPHLIERAFKTFYEVVRQFPDKPYRIAQQKRNVLKNDLSGGRVQRGKKLVFSKDLAFAEQGHQGRFTNVGITHQRDPDEFATVFPLSKSLLINLLQPSAQQRDLVFY